MIYTSYKSNVKNIPIRDDTKIILVYRYGSTIRRNDIIHFQDLGPVNSLLTEYKNDKNWSKYRKKYIDQLYNNSFTCRKLNRLIDIVNQYNVILICYEKDHLHCHRSLLARELHNITGIKYIGEWQGIECQNGQKDQVH